jgi:hypothetical protein
MEYYTGTAGLCMPEEIAQTAYFCWICCIKHSLFMFFCKKNQLYMVSVARLTANMMLTVNFLQNLFETTSTVKCEGIMFNGFKVSEKTK